MEGSNLMSGGKRKTEPLLILDMDFEEALARFAKVKPEEIKESVDRAKQKKPPDSDSTRRRPKSGGSS